MLDDDKRLVHLWYLHNIILFVSKPVFIRRWTILHSMKKLQLCMHWRSTSSFLLSWQSATALAFRTSIKTIENASAAAVGCWCIYLLYPLQINTKIIAAKINKTTNLFDGIYFDGSAANTSGKYLAEKIQYRICLVLVSFRQSYKDRHSDELLTVMLSQSEKCIVTVE